MAPGTPPNPLLDCRRGAARTAFELMRNLFILTGHAANVNKAGRTVGIVHDLDTFVGLTRRYAGAAGLL